MHLQDEESSNMASMQPVINAAARRVCSAIYCYETTSLHNMNGSAPVASGLECLL